MTSSARGGPRRAFPLLLQALAALAQTVTLTARDGSCGAVSGRLLHFDGEFYQLDGNFGRVTVDGTGNDLPLAAPARTPSPFVAGVGFAGDAADDAPPDAWHLIEAFGRTAGLYHDIAGGAERPALSAMTCARPAPATAGGAVFLFAASTSGEPGMKIRPLTAPIVCWLCAPPNPSCSRQRGPAAPRVLGLDAIVPVVAAEQPA